MPSHRLIYSFIQPILYTSQNTGTVLGIKLVYRDKKIFLPLKNSDSSGKADK